MDGSQPEQSPAPPLPPPGPPPATPEGQQQAPPPPPPPPSVALPLPPLPELSRDQAQHHAQQQQHDEQQQQWHQQWQQQQEWQQQQQQQWQHEQMQHSQEHGSYGDQQQRHQIHMHAASVPSKPALRYRRDLQHDCEAVLERLTRDGTLDDLRRKVVEYLRADPRLDELVRKEVRRSPHADAKLDTTNKANTLKQIKQDLAEQLQDSVSDVVWEAMTKSVSRPDNRIADDIELAVHEALCAMLVDELREARSMSQLAGKA